MYVRIVHPTIPADKVEAAAKHWASFLGGRAKNNPKFAGGYMAASRRSIGGGRRHDVEAAARSRGHAEDAGGDHGRDAAVCLWPDAAHGRVRSHRRNQIAPGADRGTGNRSPGPPWPAPRLECAVANRGAQRRAALRCRDLRSSAGTSAFQPGNSFPGDIGESMAGFMRQPPSFPGWPVQRINPRIGPGTRRGIPIERRHHEPTARLPGSMPAC